MMRAEDFAAAGIPLAGDDPVSVLHAEAALDWMQEYTTLAIDKADQESLASLPACAKLFVVKCCEITRRVSGVTSQSIEGLSQSFDASGDVSTSIWALASTLLRGYLRSQATFHPARRRW